MLSPISHKLFKVAYSCSTISKTVRFSSLSSLKLTHQQLVSHKSANILAKQSLDHLAHCYCSKTGTKSKDFKDITSNIDSKADFKDNTMNSGNNTSSIDSVGAEFKDNTLNSISDTSNISSKGAEFKDDTLTSGNDASIIGSKEEDFKENTLNKDNNTSNIGSSQVNFTDDIDKKEANSTDNSDPPQPDLFSNVDIDEITGGDPELIKQLKVYILEIDVQRQEGYEIPNHITTDQWKNILDLNSWHKRKKYLRFLFINEKKEENDRKRKERNRLYREELFQKRMEEERENPPHLKYCLYNNSIFIRITDTTMHHYANNRLINAMMYGQNIVIDCGFDAYMSLKEASNCAQQLMYVFAENRNNMEPFNLHLCNVGYKDRVIKVLNKYIPTMFDEGYPMNITDKHYLDMFPKEKLVYLTPHCNNELGQFDPNDIYIIGAIVDKTNVEPLSLAKAKSEGLRMARFPLDRYLAWGSGSKSLTLDQCMRIMLTLKETNDWRKALAHVPSRKIVKEVEEPDDDVSSYGQCYVSSAFDKSHEWGIAKRRERAKLSKHMDLRELLHKKDEKM